MATQRSVSSAGQEEMCRCGPVSGQSPDLFEYSLAESDISSRRAGGVTQLAELRIIDHCEVSNQPWVQPVRPAGKILPDRFDHAADASDARVLKANFELSKPIGIRLLHRRPERQQILPLRVQFQCSWRMKGPLDPHENTSGSASWAIIPDTTSFVSS